MEISINENKKIVEVWLSNEEKNNSLIKEKLKELYAKYKKTKYIVAVYESGNADLLSGTKSLLTQNRDIMPIN
jgi:hypothetical protein